MDVKEKMEDIRQKILSIAKKKGLNQQQLCGEIDVASSDGFKLMFWNNTIKAETLNKIFIALEMTEQQKWEILKEYFNLQADGDFGSSDNMTEIVKKSLELVEKEKEEKEMLRNELNELKRQVANGKN